MLENRNEELKYVMEKLNEYQEAAYSFASEEGRKNPSFLNFFIILSKFPFFTCWYANTLPAPKAIKEMALLTFINQSPNNIISNYEKYILISFS